MTIGELKKLIAAIYPIYDNKEVSDVFFIPDGDNMKPVDLEVLGNVCTVDGSLCKIYVKPVFKTEESTPAPKPLSIISPNRWIYWGRDSAYNKYYRCSCCQSEIMMDEMCDGLMPDKCERCGAKMSR